MTGGVDTARLRALAEQATPGPWQQVGDRVLGPGDRSKFEATQVAYTYSSGFNPSATQDAAFIAACDPGTVRALVEAVQAALEYVEAFEDEDQPVDARAYSYAALTRALAPFAAGTATE